MTPEILFDPSPPDLELVTAKFKFFAPRSTSHWHGWSNLPDSCRKRNANAPGGLFLKGTGIVFMAGRGILREILGRLCA